MAPSLERELELARRIAREAGRIILDVYRTDFDVIEKPEGGGPVTLADARANAYLVDELHRAFPSDGIVAEESVDASEVKKSARCWFVDPLDGTAEFVDKNGMFAVHVGVAVEGEAVLGVVYSPVDDRLYGGVVGHGCELWTAEGKRALRVQPQTDPSKMRVVVSRSHKSKKTAEVLRRMGVPQTQVREQGSVGLKCARLAEGEADVYLHPGTGSWRWDSCAPEAMLRAAGGVLTDFTGTPYRYDTDELKNVRGMLAGAPETFARVQPVCAAVAAQAMRS